jgi:hypothetical protein
MHDIFLLRLCTDTYAQAEGRNEKREPVLVRLKTQNEAFFYFLYSLFCLAAT